MSELGLQIFILTIGSKYLFYLPSFHCLLLWKLWPSWGFFHLWCVISLSDCYKIHLPTMLQSVPERQPILPSVWRKLSHEPAGEINKWSLIIWCKWIEIQTEVQGNHECQGNFSFLKIDHSVISTGQREVRSLKKLAGIFAT